MPNRQGQLSQDWTKGTRGLLSYFVLFLVIGFLIYQLFASVLLAFGYSSAAGVRGLAAALLPMIVSAYLGFIVHVQVPSRESRAPLINSFIVFLFWTMLVLGVDISIQIAYFPVEELLYSLTLASLLWRYRSSGSFKALLACCYGILAGTLASIIIFGMNPVSP